MLRPLALALISGFLLAGCGGGSDDGNDSPVAVVLPDAPKGLGTVETAPVQDATKVLPFVDYAYSNQRGDARYATLETNAGVRVVSGFLQIWKPSSLIVDAGTTAAANGSFPAVVQSTWTGIPGDATDGQVLNSTIHAANIQYVIDVTTKRTEAQALAAYLDDRRGKGYSISDGLGPLAPAWRSAAGMSTTITSMPVDATTVLYNEGGVDVGVGSATNATLGKAVDFVNNIGENGSTEPAKRFYKYARPWRWSTDVKVVPQLVPAKSATPATDGGFISGHTAEGVRKAMAIAYLVPQRFQELMARSLEMGENRILSGMHSPLDVIGGRIQAQAVAAAAIATGSNKDTLKADAFKQAQAAMQSAAGVTSADALNAYAHSQAVAVDRFADPAATRAEALRRLTFGLPQIGDKTKAAVVPKSAEVLLETRLPYLDAAQRRVVLKTTALPSGYPVMDDEEGWGRLNYVAAADGYGAFNGDVTVTMDAALGGFSSNDSWRNDIGGAGKLTKAGSGTLHLTGANTFSGGTQLDAGILSADSASALGKGDVYIAGGTLVTKAAAPVAVAGRYSQRKGATLQLTMGAAGAGRLAVTGAVALEAGALLNLKFQSGYKPAIGDTLQLITSAQSLGGRFETVTVEGFTKFTTSYDGKTLSIKIEG
ncbi:phosphatase PAP2 family protein [Roseateles amylovorans]|uniref:Phosphatase PAP2 family protein n=1 Tax=Roseateles amylovorans TaxID=2978473 RepID=A0ABY6B612_9BURK|nr:phosphatase PAP2 family protein [Roseateles amylovorans]UXH80853.1 phosphatase PAP2 family protein [Roseateles amylovorans]